MRSGLYYRISMGEIAVVLLAVGRITVAQKGISRAVGGTYSEIWGAFQVHLWYLIVILSDICMLALRLDEGVLVG